MLTLDDVQRAMCSAVRGSCDPALLGIIAGDGIAPEARLGIYRNHALLTLTQVLKATFPVVCRLVDERFFSYAAHEYIGDTLPSGPCLAEYGESFPDFLSTFPPCRNLAYLRDVARLEWALNAALHVEDAETLHQSAFSGISAKDCPDVVLTLHPSLQLLASRWPIDAIWHANQPEADPETVIDLDAGGARLQVYRHGDRVVIKDIEESTYAFLDAISRGAPLEEAAEAGIGADPGFDLPENLRMLFAEGLIIGWNVQPSGADVAARNEQIPPKQATVSTWPGALKRQLRGPSLAAGCAKFPGDQEYSEIKK